MKLEVLRVSSQDDSTSGILFDVVNGKRKFLCYTLEDEQRDVKVWGETRIPAGEYKLSLRKEGGFHSRYQAKYGNMHQGMIVKDLQGKILSRSFTMVCYSYISMIREKQQINQSQTILKHSQLTTTNDSNF